VFLLTLCRTAWMQDDSYISLRVARNVAEHGEFSWNAGDRVLVCTHPLWIGVLALGHLVTSNGHLLSIALSVLLSVFAFSYVIGRLASTWSTALIAALAMVLSRSFVDFSTGGLENPLVHALLVLFVSACLQPGGNGRTLKLTFLASLLLLTRVDLVPLLGVPMVVAGRGLPVRATLRAWSLGAIPLVLFLLVAVFYFGTVLPNPANAKVMSLALPRSVLLQQGLQYLWAAVRTDTLTIAVIVGGGGMACLWHSTRMTRALAAGVFLYVGYVTWIGGCFMSGRFFTAPFLVSLCLLARALGDAGAAVKGIVLALLAILAIPGADGLIAGSRYDRQNEIGPGIYDCRGFYFQITGWLSDGRRSHPERNVSHLDESLHVPRLIVLSAVGIPGYVLGDRVTIVDQLGLCDPLLSRLPPLFPDAFRPGHVQRHIPSGYLQTLASGVNHIENPALADYWERLHEVVSAPLCSPHRMSTVVAFATGQYDHLLKEYLAGAYAKEIRRTASRSELEVLAGPGVPWSDPGILLLEQPLVIPPPSAEDQHLETCLDSNDDYHIVYMSGAEVVGHEMVQMVTERAEAGLRQVDLQLPKSCSAITAVLVSGQSGDGIYAIGRTRYLH
jgi:arabinofuranosyltransferase